MKRILAGWVCAMLCIGSMMAAINVENGVEAREIVRDGVMYTSHLPIRINSNADFQTVPGVVNNATGDGSVGSPWIIEGWDINGAGYGYCIYIGNTTDYFEVRNCYLHHASGVMSWPYYYDTGLTLYTVQNGNIANNTASNNHNGIYLFTSSSNTVTNNTANLNNRLGIWLEFSNDNTIANNIASNNLYGIDLDYSSSNAITNNTMIDDGFFILGDQLQHWNTHTIDTTNTVNGKPVHYWKDQTGGTVPAGAGQVILANCTNVVVENQNVSDGSCGIELGFSSNNTIANNTVSSNTGYGIYITASSNNTLANNSVSNNDWGIYLAMSDYNILNANTASSNSNFGIIIQAGSEYNLITGNTVTGSFRGIALQSWSNTIINNTVSGNSEGVYLGATRYNEIDNNTISNNGHGIYINFHSNYNNITHNTVSSNGGTGIILADNCINNTIANNTVSNNGLGIYLGASNFNNIVNNIANSNANLGIYLDSSNSNILANNTALYNNYGITLDSSSFNTVTNNTASYNNCGIHLGSSSFNTIANNTMEYDGIVISGNQQSHWNTNSIDTSNTVNGKPVQYWKNQTGGTVPPDAGQIILANCTGVTVENQDVSKGSVGIQLGYSDSNTVANNNANENNWYGIWLHSSSSNTIADNTASYNDYGINFGSSNFNTIANNTASYNHYGAYTSWSSSNTIYHNNFIDNTNQAYDNTGTNFWNISYPTGGNYWSDYTGTDTMNGPNQDIPGADGIGDLPYNSTTGQGIQGGAGAQDDYPLMQPIGTEPALTPRAPIRINSNADFTPANGVSGGDGSAGNPWIIENYDINGTGYGYCIYIGNTTDYFEVRNCNLHEASGVWGEPYFMLADLQMYNVTNGFVKDSILEGGVRGLNLEMARNNTIANCTLKGQNRGFYLLNSENNDILNNSVSLSTWAGIQLDDSSNNSIEENRIFDCTGADAGSIAIARSDNVIVTGNTLTNNNGGVSVYNSLNSTLNNNVFINCSIGLSGDFLEHWITHSIDTTNTVNGKPVYYLKNQVGGSVPINAGEAILANCSNVFINDLILTNVTIGIIAGFSNNCIIDNNTMLGSTNTYGSSGVILYKSFYTSITNNEITNFFSEQAGIFLDEADNNVISYNRVSDNYYGIYTQDSTNNTVSNNTVNGSSGINIRVYRSPDSVVDNNTASFSQDMGIDFDIQSPRGICKNNIVFNSSVYGIQYASHGGVIHGNTVSSNTEAGIAISFSGHNNTIYHNNLIDNQGTYQAVDYGVDNDWDNGYPSGGNYWSDYTGTDTMNGPNQNISGADGIGDTPYTNILGGAGAQDDYPLMEPVNGATLSDTTPPASSVDSITPFWRNTSPLTITATASDMDSAVANVTLWYRFSANNTTWNHWVNFDIDTAEPWNWTFNFPDGQGYYEFYSIANDTANNTEAAPAMADASCAYDATAPEITDTSPAAGTTGDSYNFRADVTDNLNLSAVHVIYWFGSGAEINATMTHPTGEWIPMPMPETVMLEINIPLNSLDTLHYRIAAVDMAGNWNSTAVKDVIISDNDDPVADAGPDQVVDEGTVATFDGSGSTDNIGINNYTWAFTHNGTAITLYGASPTFRFWTAGNYTATLTVRDAADNTDVDTMQVNVATAAPPADTTPPVADAGPDQTVNAGTLVTFTGAGSADNVGVTNYTWTFTHNGTAITLYGVSPTFRFWTPGNYTVTLTVRDAAGNTDTDTVLITVNPVTGPGDGGDPGNYLWIIIILIVISAIALLAFMKRGKGKAPEDDKENVGEEPEEAHGGQTDPALGGTSSAEI